MAPARKTRKNDGVDIRVRIPEKKQAEMLDETDAPDDSADVKRDVENILRESGEGAVTKIERTDVATGRTYHCGQYPTKIVNKQFCAERFGGGDYVLETRVPTKTGGTRYGNRIRFSIDPSIRPAPAPAPGAAGAAGPGYESMAQRFVEQQLETMEKMQRLNLELMTGRRESRFDWAPFVPVFVAAVEGMMRGRRGGSDPVELALKMLREMKPAEREDRGLEGLLDQLETLDRIRGQIGGGGNEDGVLKTINRGLGVAERFAERIVTNGRAHRPPVAGGARQLTPAAELAEAAAPAPADPVEPDGGDVRSAKGAQLRRDTDWAAELNNRVDSVPSLALWMPPDSAAGVVYENMDDQAFDSLMTELTAFRPDVEDPAARAAAWGTAQLAHLEAPGWRPEIVTWFGLALENLAFRCYNGEPDDQQEREAAAEQSDGDGDGESAGA